MNRLALYEQIMQQLAQGRTQDAQQVFSQIVQHSLAEALQTDRHQTLTEIKWRSTEVVNSALDAAIYCGFEAETVWDPDLIQEATLTTDEVDSLRFDDSAIQDLILSEVSNDVISQIRNDYFDGITDSAAYYDVLDKATRRAVFRVMEEPSRLDDFVAEELDFDEIEEDFEAWRQGLVDFSRKKIQDKQEHLDDPEIQANPNAVEKQQRMIDIYQDQIAQFDSDSADYDQQEALREYIKQESGSVAHDRFHDWAAGIVDDEYQDEVNDETWQEVMDSYTIDDWIEDQDGSLSNFLRGYDIYVMEDDESSIEQIGEMVYDGWISSNSDFSDYLAGEYNTTGDDPTIWHIETDSSIQGGAGAEIVSPVYETPRQMLAEMFSLFDWLQGEGAESNQSTGLHVTMSMPGTQSEVNAVKMAVMLDDVYLLKQFARLDNIYTKSQLERLKDQAQSVATGSERSIEELEKMLETSISRQKFRSIHLKGSSNDEGNQLIEFRIAGGGDYLDDRDKVQDAVVRYATTMQLGYDSDAYRREYATKLVRMLNKSIDLDIGEQPASTDNTLQILTQAFKELGITNSSVRNVVVRKLKWLNTHMPNMPDQSDREKLELYKDNVREIIYEMAEAVTEGQIKEQPTARIARMLRTVLNTVGLGIVELAGGIQKAYMRGDYLDDWDLAEERISALAKLLAAPKLLDKFGIEKIRRIIKLKPGGTLLVLGSAINQVLAGEYDQIDPDVDFATIDESLQTDLRRLGRNTTGITDTNSKEYQTTVLPEIQARIKTILDRIEEELAWVTLKRTNAPVWAKHFVRPETGDVETALTADLTKPVEANQWYVMNSDYSIGGYNTYMLSKFKKAGIGFQ